MHLPTGDRSPSTRKRTARQSICSRRCSTMRFGGSCTLSNRIVSQVKDNQMSYDIFEHKHRFSVWAAARAVQNRFGAKVKDLREALENCGIVEFLNDSASMQVDQEQFDVLHRDWCVNIIDFLAKKGVTKATFGRAAKLVAVYLKSMVVIGGDPDCRLAQVAHPPIDSIMLQNLSRSAEVRSPHKRKWRFVKWTQLSEEEYYQLVSELFVLVEPGMPLWHLEKYWTVTRE